MINSEKEKIKFFEEHYDEILHEINKRRAKWTMKGVVSLDFDDVSQILLRHLYIKIDQYNPDKGPLVKWINMIISNQIKNILRNIYYNHSRPRYNRSNP